MAFLKQIWRLTKGYLTSAEKKSAALYLVALTVLTVSIVYVQVLLNQWYNNFYSSLQAYDADAIIHYLWVFTGLAFIHIIIAVYTYYIRQLLSIKWRRWMTDQYINRWMDHKKYYYLQLFGAAADNPDQRISEDIKMFVDYFLQFTVGLLKAVLTLGAFIVILWNLSDSITFTVSGLDITIPHYLVWAAIGYAILGTAATHFVGRRLARLRYVQQKFEADFRFSLIRLREHAQSIAFYGGENNEASFLNGRFRSLLNNFVDIVYKEKQLVWLTSGYAQIAIIFPLLVSIPSYLRKTINLGGLMQISSAFGRVQDSLSYFVDIYTQLAEWRSVINRLSEFTDHMNTVVTEADSSSYTATEGHVFAANTLTVVLPDGRPLLKDFSFRLNVGDNLLIRGTNGAGKSTLLRVFAGLWPFVTGTLEHPPKETVFFIPQKPYLPLGSLRNALQYPKNNVTISDEILAEALHTVKLERLIPALDAEEDWSSILSGGELQRIAFARIFIHRPDWLILDEATSAVDEESEAHLFEELQQKLPQTTLISVSHRSTLERYHNQILYLDKTTQHGELYSIQPISTP